MKVILLNTSERTGGAAIAANRLMKALIRSGIEAKTLVLSRQTEDDNVVSIQSSFLNRRLTQWNFLCERWIIFVHNWLSRKNLFKVSIANTGFDISKHPLIQEADLIHIHWINQGFLSLNSIRRLLLLDKPIVWTMHDLWAATGICHYPGDCEQYRTRCCCCPLLVYKKYNSLASDLFNQKKTLNWEQIHYVGCSHWISGKIRNSKLLRDAPVSSIPNPIDTEIFYPKDKNTVRKKWQLPIDKRLFLFSAAKIADTRKGVTYFMDACQQLKEKYPKRAQTIEIVWMGKGDEAVFSTLQMTAHTLRYLSNESELADIYSSVDAFVIPSLEDNLPNTIMESMACGVPCVGFDVGGIPEMIDHKTNGYVAEYQSAEDLAQGIYWTLFEANYEQLSQNARQKALDRYSENVVAEQYIHLYQQLV